MIPLKKLVSRVICQRKMPLAARASAVKMNVLLQVDQLKRETAASGRASTLDGLGCWRSLPRRRDIGMMIRRRVMEGREGRPSAHHCDTIHEILIIVDCFMRHTVNWMAQDLTGDLSAIPVVVVPVVWMLAGQV